LQQMSQFAAAEPGHQFSVVTHPLQKKGIGQGCLHITP